ncbi:MAG: DUF1156 domain-containing protein [Candidatus Helarchaeota archaeon]
MEKGEERPKVLIEEWLPFEEIGIECQRERGVVSAMPAINFLHVWWARRPLTASKAAILGSILPHDFNRNNFLKLMKFEENLKEIHKNIISEKRKGKRSLIGYKKNRAFSLNLNEKEKNLIKKNIIFKDIKILDPMAGGGSIPFESIRLDLDTYLSELNSVALAILYGTLFFFFLFGKEFANTILEFGMQIDKKIKNLLKKYFYWQKGQINYQYIWIRTVICPNPKCNLYVPLAPNWDLIRTKNKRVILKLNFSKSNFTEKRVKFHIIENPPKNILKENLGTINRGKGKCPRCNTSITNEYIKNEAQNGRMGHQLAAISYKEYNSNELKFRTPTNDDLRCLEEVKKALHEKWEYWLTKDLIPNEKFPKGCDNRPINYGIDYWYKFFNYRQLFTNISIAEEIRNLKESLLQEKDISYEKVKAIILYLQLALDKICDYNSISTMWSPTTLRIAHTFSRHDFSFKWSYAEIDIVGKGYDWAIENIVKSYNGLIKLIGNTNKKPKIFNSPAQSLKNIKDGEISVIIVDPPYYDNVMYAELSDFFYVWLKRNLKEFFPTLFSAYLTDKDNEVVANISRFENIGKSKSKLAKDDYKAKMQSCFKEMNRVLNDNGVLTIMFTHKSTDAWDSLAMALMESGFEITASWPIHTEAELSLHIAKKNAVRSTILLICRKRLKKQQELWWEDDVLPSIKRIVENKAKKFKRIGIDGVDLFISCFGPALREFSKGYPVKKISGELVRAEEAIEVARKVVIEITLQNIIKKKSFNIDNISKFYLIAWYFFKARTFPFDEARRLALAVGLNIEDLKTNYKILKKKSGDVEILLPTEREKIGVINIDNPNDYGILINAVHIGILAFQEGGRELFDNVIEKLRRNTDKSLRLYMETLFNVLPDVKDLSKNLPEKKIIGEILMTTEEIITPKGGKITDYLK